MKRYECIKTLREFPTESIIFQAGYVYEQTITSTSEWTGFTAIMNRFSEPSYFNQDMLLTYFKELDTIEDNDSYTYLDAEEYVHLDTKGLRKGLAICIASALTLGAILYWALIWRS